jgi:hypothetical protein
VAGALAGARALLDLLDVARRCPVKRRGVG